MFVVRSPVSRHMLPRKSWLYYAISVAGLPLYLLAFSSQAHVGALPRGGPAEGVTFPARFNGVPVESDAEIRFLAEGLEPGARADIAPSDGRPRAVAIGPWLTRVELGVTLVSGLLFWAVAAFVFASRALRSPETNFFWCTFLYGLAIMVGGVHFPGSPRAPAVAGALLQFACLAALPPLFIYLTLTFPRRRESILRRRWLVPLLSGVAGILIARQWSTYLAFARDPHPQAFRAMALAGKAADVLMVAQVLAAFSILAHGMRRLELTRERAQVKWLLWGFAVGVTPYVFLRTLLGLAGVESPFGAAFDRVFEMAIPVAFVSAVVLYRLLDIDIIIRRSVIYVALAILMTAIIAGVGLLIGGGVGARRAPPWIVPLAVGIVAGVAFMPLRRAIGWWVDRTFFKMTLGYGRALDELGACTEELAGQRDLANEIDSFLAKLLRPRSRVVLLREGEEIVATPALPPAEASALFDSASRAARGTAAGGTLARVNATSLPEVESDSFPDELSRRGFVLGQEIAGPDGAEGWILLGVRETERRYIERDVHLLRDAASEASRALGRIRLVQRAAEESMARRRSEEIARMKSDFLSRVAHDLRTPLASILWSAENLLDGVTGRISDRQAEYLGSVRASARHLDRLVTGLLEISRHERGVLTLEIGPVDVGAVLEQAISTIRPLAAEKKATIAMSAPAGRVMAEANAEKLLEVALNLLDNAVKYSPSGAAIDVVAREDGGHVTVTVRDRGPGLGGADEDAIFERFNQGAPSPHGRRHGFGLGLYIVRTFVEMMGGDVAASDHPEGGALFTCTIRAARRAEGETS